MTRSLRRRLLLVLSAGVLTAWLASAFFSYLDTRRQIDALLDANLVHAADLLLALMAPVAAGGHPRVSLPAFSEGDEPLIAYRVTAGDDARVLASAGALPFQPREWQAGFSDRPAASGNWRVYGAEGEGGLRVEVAQRHDVRGAFAASVAAHIMHPVWFAVPLLGLLIWLSVRWGLAPLQAIAGNVARRSAADLAPLDPISAPTEIRPLLEALNSLFVRIGALLEKERRFTADAAHELRTPLAAIRTHAEVARAARREDERDEALGHVVEGTGRATRLVEQLLVLARLDHQAISADGEAVDLEVLLRGALAEEAPRAAAKCIELEMDGTAAGADEAGWRVRGSSDLLKILIRNLLDNALQYTPDGGRVGAGLSRRGDGVVLEIRDTGPGIPPTARGRVLDRFYRLEPSGTGCGLGLSIVARIVEIHGASLKLEGAGNGCGLSAKVIFSLDNFR
jgi:two-component system sensor histidine kinase QseC